MTTDGDNLLETYASAGRFVVGGLVALVLTYVSAIEIGFQSISHDWLNFSRLSVATQKLGKDEGARIKPVRDKAYTVTLPAGPDASHGASGAAALAGRQAQVEELHSWKDEIKARRSKVRDTLVAPSSVALLGFSLTLPFKLVAAAWLLAAASLMTYAAYHRTRFYRDLAHAVDLGDAKPRLLPIWLAPLPWRLRGSGGELRRVLGLELAGPPWGAMILAAVIAIFLMLCLEVTAIGQEAVHIYRHAAKATLADMPFRSRVGGALSGLVFVVAAALAAGCAAFLLMSPLPRVAPSEPWTPRRTLMFSAAAGAAIITLGYQQALGLLDRDRSVDLCRKSVRYSPRRRRRRQMPLVGPGSVNVRLNPRSKVMHLVAARSEAQTGYIDVGPGARPDRWALVTQPDPAAFNSARRPYAVERWALSLVSHLGPGVPSEAYAEATAFIVRSLDHVPKEARQRLLDLAAGLAARSSDATRLADLAKRALGESDRWIERGLKWRYAADLLKGSAPQPKDSAGRARQEQAKVWLRRWAKSPQLPWRQPTERKPAQLDPCGPERLRVLM